MIIPEICLACKWAIGNDCRYDDDCWSFSPSITCFEPKFDPSYSNSRDFLNQWLIVESTMENLEKVIIKKKPIDYELKTQLKAIIEHYNAVKKLKRLYKVLLRDFEQFSHIFNKALSFLHWKTRKNKPIIANLKRCFKADLCHHDNSETER